MEKLEYLVKKARRILSVGLLGIIAGCSQSPNCEQYQKTFCNKYKEEECQGFCKGESDCPEGYQNRDNAWCEEKRVLNDLEGWLFGSYYDYTAGNEEIFFMHNFTNQTTHTIHIDEESKIVPRYTPSSHFGILTGKKGGPHRAFLLQSNGKLFASRFNEVPEFEEFDDNVDMATWVGNNLWYVKDNDVYTESEGKKVLINENVNLPFLDSGHLELAPHYKVSPNIENKIIVAHNEGENFDKFREATLYVMDTLGENVHALTTGERINSPISWSGITLVEEQISLILYLFVKDQKIYQIDTRGNNEKQKFVGLEPEEIMTCFEGLFIRYDQNNKYQRPQIYRHQYENRKPLLSEIELPSLFPINSRHDKFYRWIEDPNKPSSGGNNELPITSPDTTSSSDTHTSTDVTGRRDPGTSTNCVDVGDRCSLTYRKGEEVPCVLNQPAYEKDILQIDNPCESYTLEVESKGDTSTSSGDCVIAISGNTVWATEDFVNIETLTENLDQNKTHKTIIKREGNHVRLEVDSKHWMEYNNCLSGIVSVNPRSGVSYIRIEEK